MIRIGFFSSAAWPTSPSPGRNAVRHLLAARVAEAREQPQLVVGALLLVVREEERPVLRAHRRRELRHDQLRDRLEVALALHQAGDAGQVRLEPVLLLVLPSGLAQVGDHLVDVVREVRDLSAGLNGDRSGQVALGHGGGHVRNRSHLGREVRRELVHVLGEPAPRAGHALDLRLTAELALGADLLGHSRDLVGERRQLVDHRVERLLQLAGSRPWRPR